jgi:hypothetical protein
VHAKGWLAGLRVDLGVVLTFRFVFLLAFDELLVVVIVVVVGGVATLWMKCQGSGFSRDRVRVPGM